MAPPSRSVLSGAVSAAEERERLKRDALAAVVAEKEARARRDASGAGELSVLRESEGLGAPSGPLLRRYRGARCSGGAATSSSDAFAEDVTPAAAAPMRVSEKVISAVQQTGAEAAPAGPQLPEVSVAVGSCGGGVGVAAAAAAGGLLSSSDPVVRDATPAEAAAKRLDQVVSTYVEEIELEEAPPVSVLVRSGRRSW